MQLAMAEAAAPTIAGPPDLEQAFDAHARMVYRTAWRITGNTADAEDVMQTVFLRLLRRDAAYGALENIESYLRRAAVNAALDHVRSAQATRSAPLEDAPPGPSGESAREAGEALRRALAQLNHRDAEVFTLRFIEGYTNPEIAAIAGISQVHVAVILHRTRKQLQSEIRSYMGGRS